MRPVVDEDGDRDLGKLVAASGEHLSGPHGAELAYREDLAVGGALLRRPAVAPAHGLPSALAVGGGSLAGR